MEEQGLFDEMVSRLGQELKVFLELVSTGKLDASSVEHRLRGALRKVGCQATGVLLEAADASLCAKEKVHDRRTRTVITLFGPADVTRSRTKKGRYPLDEALGLQGRHGWTGPVQEAVSLLSCEKGFESVCDLLKRLMDLSISPPAAQQIAERAGAQAMELLEHCPPPTPDTPRTLIMAVDGCQAPERDGWHEVKVGCLYAHEHRAKTAGGRGKLVHKEYLATLQDAGGLGRQLWERTQRWRVNETTRMVGMGDGAPWIWNLFGEHFPGAVEIVDFYHAAEHLWAAGEALYGDRHTSMATRSWVRRYVHRLRQGRVDLVTQAIQRSQDSQGPLSADRQDIVRRNLDYFRTNRQRMRYDQFKRWHLPIGTGAVEGSCKFVVQSRFKLPGCRWSHAGLTKMLALKQLRLNGHWSQLWPFTKAA